MPRIKKSTHIQNNTRNTQKQNQTNSKILKNTTKRNAPKYKNYTRLYDTRIYKNKKILKYKNSKNS